MTINDAWCRIEEWLRSQAPATYASLPEPASHDDLAALERQLGIPCPEGLRESLLRHDGSGELILPIFYRFATTRQIEHEYRQMVAADERRTQQLREHHQERPHQFPNPLPGEHQVWNPKWIPVSYDESGNLLFISQVEDETLGKIGMFDVDSGGSFDANPVFLTLTHLMQAAGNALHAARFDMWGQWHPYTDNDGFLEWREAGEP